MALKVAFPIGVKLVSIITLLLSFSLGLITFLVWLLVSADIGQTAQDNNRFANKMAAESTEALLNAVRSNVSVLLKDLTLTERSASLIDSFFEQNPDIALIEAPGTPPLVNERFFLSNEIEYHGAGASLALSSQSLNGKAVLFNAASSFEGLPVLTLLFPWRESTALVFFSVQSLIELFGAGTNTSFLINGGGLVLAHPDQSLRDGGVSNDPFIAAVLAANSVSGEGLETRYTDAQGLSSFACASRLSARSGSALVLTTIPADVVFEGINATTRRNIYLSIIVWFLGVLFVWFFAKTLSKPLEELKAAAEAIEDGRYHIQLEHKSHDETGVLTESVISMSHVLGNFEKFTNKQIARLAREGKLLIGGADKQATIFFSDIRGFTAISEKLEPDEVVEFLNDYMDRMVSCVILTGGVVDKFIGDAIVAHWGAVESTGGPVADALNGVRAALMMRASLWSFNQGRGGDKKPLIKIGCGLNSGTVVAGQIGSDERLVFTIIGDAVSFADRTETFNKPFGTEILITENTWRLVGNLLVTEEMPSVSEKGWKVRMFAVVNMRDPVESERLLADAGRIPKTAPEVICRYLGAGGPQTLAELRTLLGTPTPDLTIVNTDEEEKKYQVSSAPKK